MYDAESRREFLRKALLFGTAVAAPGSARAAFLLEDGATKPPNDKLNIGAIGVTGRGGANLRGVAGENIVALCDIDRLKLAEAAKLYPGASTMTDYRELLDREDLDAVVISTPDHTHAIPAIRALQRGLAVYCEKPLAHSVHEVRRMREVAREHGNVTQMGTQIHAGDNYRRVVEIVRAGLLGPVRRVHVWMNGLPRPGVRVEKSTPPEHVNYDLWLGPAPYRPYHESSFHFNWRYWWDFGGGVLADFGCHYMDLPHWALGLTAPVTVEAEGEKSYEGDNDVPSQMRVDYHYPARGDAPAVDLTWYHGGWKPEGAKVYEKHSAVLFEGDRGRLVADYHSHKHFFDDSSLTGAEIAKRVEPIASSRGHHAEWLHAIKTGGETTCNFEYSGALAESVLLGNVAYRAGEKLEWNTETLEAAGSTKAAQYVRREYRKGWELG